MTGFAQNPFLLLVLLSCSSVWICQAFCSNSLVTSSRRATSCRVLADPPMDYFSHKKPRAIQKPHNMIRKPRSNNHKKRYPNNKKKEDVWSSGRWNRAVEVESQLLGALEELQYSIKHSSEGDSSGEPMQIYPLAFPAIRECNAALATFGDGEDLLRSLRLYFKMRKAASLSDRYPSKSIYHSAVPTPNLVTFSTLMSRAVHLGKPLVAIRLWNIMRNQPDFFSSDSPSSTCIRIVPDVKAANILMNCYAKLGSLESAQDLLEQMLRGDGNDVPRMAPNLVTYNTLLDACHKSGEIDSALRVKEQLESAGLTGDARTYTTLIATVARKQGAASGANDPSLGFSLLSEMQERNIRPNGMTYSALIDVCGRCRRSDLALNGLANADGD